MSARSTEPDPVMALVRCFEEAEAKRDPKDQSDAETESFVEDVIMPFHANLAKATPTTREGVCAILNVAIEELAECPGRGGGDYRFALLETALAAVKGGAV